MIKTCICCGSEFKTVPSEIGKYCSVGCHHKHRPKLAMRHTNDGKKICATCSKKLPFSSFSKNVSTPDNLSRYCRECCAVRKKKHKKIERNGVLKRNYGITLDDYNEILIKQNHVCAICGGEETLIIKGKNRDLAVDHNHETGKVRGLLCSKCNTAIGFFNEDIRIIKTAIRYIKDDGFLEAA